MGLIANIFGYLLKLCFQLCGNSYGWAVILFSVIIKAILFPLTLKQQKSLKQNQELQPKLNELQEKYKNDQQRLALEYQNFMKENKYNPFGGCLLMILQLFVLIGILYVVSNPIKYMEKESDKQINVLLQDAIIKQDFSGDKELFLQDATKFYKANSGDDRIKKMVKEQDLSGDAEIYIAYYKNTNRYHELKILKERYDLSFFGINLGDITAQNMSDLRLWIFPVLTTIFYYISLWMISKKQNKNKQVMKDADGNEIEMPNMATMNILMPLMSGWISFSVPQGMGLYWFSNSFLQVAIQWVTDLLLDKEEKNKSDEVVVEAIKEDEDDNNPIKDDNKSKGPNPNSSKKKKKKK